MLSGFKVISFNHFHAGPMAAQLLADMGADVIAVEPLDGAFHRNWAVANHFVAGQSVNLLTTGRNKRSLALDMKSASGKEVARRLIEAGQYAAARPELESLLARQPEDVEAHYLLGLVALQLNDAGSAVGHLRRVVNSRPRDTLALKLLARALAVRGATA